MLKELKKNIAANDLQCYTLKEVANFLSASEHTIYNLIMSGALEAFTIGVKGSKKPVYRITKEALKRYIKTSTFEVQKGVLTNG